MRRLLVAAAVAFVLCPAGRSAAADFTKIDTKVVMSDGVSIAVSYFQPTGPPPAAGWPAVMLLHGLGQTRNTSDFVNWSPNSMAAQFLAPNGYAVLTYDARAHGQSGGQFTLDGPRELADFRELLTWLTARHPVDAKHVGAYGASYGGAIVLKAAVAGFPLAAIAPVATWTDLYEALAPQGLVRAGILFAFSRDIPPERYGAQEAALLADALAERNLPALRAYAATRSTRAQLGDIRIPTFILQGRRDFAFDANQALAAYRSVRGPKRLYFGDFGHAPAENPAAEFDYVSGEVRAWFDHYLKGVANGIDKRAPIEIARDPWRQATKSFKTLPKPRSLSFAFKGRSTLTADGKVVRTTRRLGHVETFGSPLVTVSLSSKTGYKHLVAVLSALTPGGKETVVADGGAEPAAGANSTRTITIRLQNEITSVPRGSRLRVTLAARSTLQNVGNLVYLTSVAEASTATVRGVRLKLPVLRKPISP